MDRCGPEMQRELQIKQPSHTDLELEAAREAEEAGLEEEEDQRIIKSARGREGGDQSDDDDDQSEDDLHDEILSFCPPRKKVKRGAGGGGWGWGWG